MTAWQVAFLVGAAMGFVSGLLLGLLLRSRPDPPDPGERSPAPRRRSRLRLVGKRAA